MRNDLLTMLFLLTTLVIGAAVEELVPKSCGVGLPVLMSAAMCVAVTKHPVVTILFAISAGAFEDSLSSLPIFTSVSFFVAVAVVAHFSRIPRAGLVLAYPVYQLWLKLLVPSLGGGIWTRVMVAVPYGVAAALAVGLALIVAERRAALDQA